MPVSLLTTWALFMRFALCVKKINLGVNFFENTPIYVLQQTNIYFIITSRVTVYVNINVIEG